MTTRPAKIEPDDESVKAQRSVQSVEVGGRLLLALADELVPMSLKDLAAKADLPAARAHPYLVSFGKLGLVEQDPASQRYALGPAALRIGLSSLHQLDPIKVATPVVEALAARTGQVAVIAVWANFGPTVVRMIEGEQPLHVNMRVGTVMSILGTATGRAFAAVLPRSRVEQALASHASDGAAVDMVGEIRKSVEEWRAHGITRAAGRPIPGVNAFSAPVFDHEGEAALVVTLLGHEDHFSPNWQSACAQAVREAAHDISARLGHRRVRTSRTA